MNDNTTHTADVHADEGRALPETGAYRLESLMPAPHDLDADADGDRNPVFTSLVSKEGDVVGLVAYSIYKQNKHDWLLAFRRTRGRDPAPGEMTSYIVGESTPRRLSTYRYLASATLAGQGPDIAAGKGGQNIPARGFATSSNRSSGSDVTARILSVLALAAVVVIGALLVARLGLLAH